MVEPRCRTASSPTSTGFFFPPLLPYEALSWDSIFFSLFVTLYGSLFSVSGCLQAAGLLVVVECGWEEEIDAGLRGLMCVGWCHGTSGGICFCSVF